MPAPCIHILSSATGSSALTSCDAARPDRPANRPPPAAPHHSHDPKRARLGSPRDTAHKSIAAAVERAVQAYRPEGLTVREVVVMLEQGPGAVPDPAPVYVDVYDSGYGHGI